MSRAIALAALCGSAACLALAGPAAGAPWSLSTGAGTELYASLASIACVSPRGCVAVGSRRDRAGFEAPLGERWNGRRWSVLRTRTPRGASSSSFADVACSPGRRLTCIAVGQMAVGAGPEQALAEHWNGRRWSILRVPGGGLTGVSCPARTACTAVGRHRAVRWNGRRWTVLRTVRRRDLVDVDCPTRRACVALETDELSHWWAEHWNGRRRSVRRISVPLNDGTDLSRVSCSSARACTAVGSTPVDEFSDPVAVRWNGRRWSSQRTPSGRSFPPPQGLDAVSCTSATTCTAVGELDQSVAPLAERWNGRRWRIERTSDSGGALTGVACVAAGACKAVGSSLDSFGNRRAVAERRRAGGRWSLQRARTPGTAREGSLAAVACRSAAACTAVGLLVGAHLEVAESWDGRRWTFDSVSASPREGAPLLHAVSCPAATCVAVGSILTNAGDEPLVARQSAGKWSLTRLRDPGRGDLAGVSCTSATQCMAVGNADEMALAESWDGAKWTRQPVPSPVAAAASRLTAVSCTAATACTAVGSWIFTNPNGGESSELTLAETWDGTRWTVEPTPTRQPASRLTAISCASAGACVAVGASCPFSGCDPEDDQNQPGNPSVRTLALHRDATAWTLAATPDPPGTANLLTSVSCASPATCTAVGIAATFDTGTVIASDGFAEDWDGATWRLESTVAPAPFGELNGVSCAGTACTAVGDFDHGDHTIPLIARRP